MIQGFSGWYLDSKSTPHPFPKSRELAMLQYICSYSASGELPSLYLGSDLTVDYRRRIYGGEALIFWGEFRGQTVAIREVFQPEGNTWDSEAGKRTIMV
jgi:hypothetical protein